MTYPITLFLAQTFASSSLLFGAYARMWYALPLVVAISLVYGATRHEHPKEILHHAVRSAIGICVFMSIIFAIIFVAGYWN